MNEEKHILSQCLKKDPKAEFALYNLYKVQMMGVCRRYAYNQSQAVDIFQEGFIQVFESLPGFKGESTLKTWMSRIFIYTAINYLKKEKRYTDRVKLDVIFNDDSLPEEEEIEEVEQPLEKDPETVLACMAELPENYRLILNQYAIDGLSHAQISENMGISESHSRVILARARKMLVSILNKKNDEARVAKY